MRCSNGPCLGKTLLTQSTSFQMLPAAIIQKVWLLFTLSLDNQNLIDRDIEIIVEQAILKRRLLSLSLKKNNSTPVGTSILASAFTHPDCRLVRLTCSNNKLGDDGIGRIFETLPNTLMFLDVDSNEVTDIGVERIAQALRTNVTLTELRLSGNPISDEGIQRLLRTILQYNNTLKTLTLANNRRMTDASYDIVVDFIKENRFLEYLYIGGSGLSKDSEDKLKQICKQTKPKVYV